jgi:hypothetical protein
MSAVAHVVAGMRIGRLARLSLSSAAAAAVAVRHALATGHATIGVAPAAVRHRVSGMLAGLRRLGCGRAVPGVLALGLLSRMPGMVGMGVGGGRSLRDRGSSGRHGNRNEKQLHH